MSTDKHAAFRKAVIEKHGNKGYAAAQLLSLGAATSADSLRDAGVALLSLLCAELGWDEDEIITLSDEIRVHIETEAEDLLHGRAEAHCLRIPEYIKQFDALNHLKPLKYMPPVG